MVNEDCQHTWFMINDELSLRRGDNSGFCCSYTGVPVRVINLHIINDKLMT